MSNKLKLIKEIESKNGRRMAIYKCYCGRFCEKSISRVNTGYVSTCGHKVHLSGINIKHGMRKSSEYATWISIKDRVFNKKNKNYNRYSKLGMSEKLSKEFTFFYSEIGKKPSPTYQVDRIDNNIGYFEGNIRWVNRSVQQRNKKSSLIYFIDNKKFESLKDISTIYKVTINTVYRWFHGFLDKRRINNKNGGYTPPKKGFTYVNRY